MVDKIVTHSRKVLSIAKENGWLIGAKYTNLRNIKHLKNADFIDIDWKSYDFEKHLNAVKQFNPKYTVAKDVENISELDAILKQAEILKIFAKNVIIVPKCLKLEKSLTRLIPEEYILGYSVPTNYGSTPIDIKYFHDRKVHLLGGRPERQRNLAYNLNIVSIDSNRFTLDAKFGDYFNGLKFAPHPSGGYENCLKDSIVNINKLWLSYGRQKNLSFENVWSNV